MGDAQLAAWTRAGGSPIRMGALYVTDREARFSYDPEFAACGLPGLSLVYPPALYGDNSIVHRTPGTLHPRFRSLIPPGDEQSFQRKLTLAYLRRRGIEPATAAEADLALLAHCGHGGIGHVDVFPNDAEARDWYAHPDSGPLVPVGERLGLSLKEFIVWLDADARLILESLGPTPSVGGAIPKLLVAIPAEGWDGRIALPNKTHNPDRIDVVLKIERTASYPGLVDLEAMALELHREAGFEVPRFWHAEVGGLPALAIERFDRTAADVPLPMESLYSVLAGGARDIQRYTDGSLDRIGNVISLADPLLIGAKQTAREHLLRRLTLALLTGNGDLHLENLSLLGPAGEARFSPVYDPTPMRAYALHNLLCAVPFGAYGEQPVDVEPLTDALLRLASGLGVRRPTLVAIVEESLAATADYPARVDAVSSLPGENRARLTAIHQDISRRLAHLPMARGR